MVQSIAETASDLFWNEQNLAVGAILRGAQFQHVRSTKVARLLIPR
jgi:hypothetical protein